MCGSGPGTGDMALKEEQRYRSWVEVDLDHFTQNWNEMKRLVGPAVRIMQVVKADAYGHGAMEIANVALKNGAACLGVANAGADGSRTGLGPFTITSDLARDDDHCRHRLRRVHL